MVLDILTFIIILSIYSYIGVVNVDAKIKLNILDKNQSLYFYIIYYILFIILCLIFTITVCHSRILKQTGPSGPIGFRGNKGVKGIDGICNIECKIPEITNKLMDAIQNTYNDLLKKDNKPPISIILEVKDKDGIIIKRELKNLKLNAMIDYLVNSDEYKQSVESKDKPKDVDDYIIDHYKKWIILIYNSLHHQYKTTNNKENIFIDRYAGSNEDDSNKILWIDNKNPFDEINKYDLSQWGTGRIIKPLTIKINDNPNNVNYLPQDSKPPLKLIHTNYLNIEYENSINNTSTPDALKKINKYPRKNKNKLCMFWKNNNSLTYKNETYYPVGDIAIGGDSNKSYKSLSTTTGFLESKEEGRKYDFETIQTKNNSKGTTITTDKVFDYQPLGSQTEDIFLPPKERKLSFKNPNKSNILITGDIVEPDDYEKLWDNKDSYEENNLTIWRAKCPYGYESLSDIANFGFDKPKNGNKCVPEKCLIKNENATETISETYDNNKIIGVKSSNKEGTNENSFNFFRYQKSTSKNNKPLYKINEDCLKNNKNYVKPVEDKNKRIGLGWHGIPYRDPKYSIFSYLVQMPEAFISSKSTNYKYYIIQSELYNNDPSNDSILKTSAKNLYFILTLNYNNNKYDRCLSTDGSQNILRNKIRNENEAYWIIEPTIDTNGNKDYNEIRLKSKQTGNYFKHDRNKNHRRDIAKSRVFESQSKSIYNKKGDVDNSLIFVNIKSAFGTNTETSNETSAPRNTEKYYLSNKNKNNESSTYTYPQRGIITEK